MTNIPRVNVPRDRYVTLSKKEHSSSIDPASKARSSPSTKDFSELSRTSDVHKINIGGKAVFVNGLRFRGARVCQEEAKNAI